MQEIFIYLNIINIIKVIKINMKNVNFGFNNFFQKIINKIYVG